MTVLRLSGEVISADLIRLTVAPAAQNGLGKVSHVMIDKAVTVPREKIGKPHG